MEQATVHDEQLEFLKRIEGQIQGIQKMIKDKRYCVDIITQLHSVVGAVLRVEEKIFQKHLEGCVINALKGKSEAAKQVKINEVLVLISRFRKL